MPQALFGLHSLTSSTRLFLFAPFFFLLPALRSLLPSREMLSDVFDTVVQVEPLSSNDEVRLALLQRPELGVTFTKIHVSPAADRDISGGGVRHPGRSATVATLAAGKRLERRQAVSGRAVPLHWLRVAAAPADERLLATTHWTHFAGALLVLLLKTSPSPRFLRYPAL